MEIMRPLKDKNNIPNKGMKVALRLSCIKKLCNLCNTAFNKSASKDIVNALGELKRYIPVSNLGKIGADGRKSIDVKLSELSDELKKSA